uniref:Tryptophyllin-like peptide PbT-1 n=1 Tax=Phyllomedusa burmeisteri TaxID=39413 RepID=TY01_PHYBU|nr:RecName: Full=Tryptophyllin-like peptide PbT-1 [Phyllomedusa burmeisteri]
EPPPWVPV